MKKYSYDELNIIKGYANEKAFRTNTANRFYSVVRQVKEFTKNHDLNEIIESLKEKYSFDDKGQYYYNLLNNLNNKIYKDNFDKEGSLYILVNVVDSECEMYKIYESESKMQNIQKEIRNKFGFYDNRLINVEEMYIKFYKNEDDYSFSKKLEY